jgi:hypothetical protein
MRYIFMPDSNLLYTNPIVIIPDKFLNSVVVETNRWPLVDDNANERKSSRTCSKKSMSSRFIEIYRKQYQIFILIFYVMLEQWSYGMEPI